MVPKFRAWDKENDRMIYPSTEGVCFELTEEGINILDLSIEPYDWVFPHLDSVLMQSTGLKDKNGVEIFEGDVVKVSDGGNEEDSYTSVVKNYADEGYPAFDIEAPSSWYYESNVLSTIMGGDYETIEVIGNIWENPNLLEQTYEN